MSLYKENGDSAFKGLWVTKSGLSDKKPDEENRISIHNAEMIADAVIDLFGMWSIGSHKPPPYEPPLYE